MTPLQDILMQRLTAAKGTADVDCGGLGILTVEGLSPREFALLSRGEDAPRRVFYAACRQLQLAGEALREGGGIFTPEQVMDYVTAQEAQAAYEVIAGMSGGILSPSGAAGSDHPEEPPAPIAEAFGASAEEAGAGFSGDIPPTAAPVRIQTGAREREDVSSPASVFQRSASSRPDSLSRNFVRRSDPAFFPPAGEESELTAQQTARALLEGLVRAAAAAG